MIELENYGWRQSILPDGAAGLPARVTAVHKERYQLICRRGEVYARLKAGVYFKEGPAELFPTVGDFVLLQYEESGDSLIIRTLPRKSCFIRRDPGANAFDQAVAANIDTAFIMTSLNRDFNLKRIERYVILAWQSGANPVVILTKADLVDDCAGQVTAVRSMIPGVDVIPVSAVSGMGIDRLGAYLTPGQTVVFLGMSGVGKSSLLNALTGYEAMDVNTLHKEGRGRHTTTRRQLFMLPSGGMVIDTPGMREIGFWDSGDWLGGSFAQIEALLGTCRFSDCAHGNEPGCAILAALAGGELSADLWEKYGKLRREARHSDNRAAYLQRKQERQQEQDRFSKRKSGEAYAAANADGRLISKLPVKHVKRGKKYGKE